MDKNSFFARTMHTPDSPERARLRASLREISRALMPLHRSLIESARSDYVFAYDASATPSELIELLQSDPFFAWLRPFTSIIVDIDEMTRTDFEIDDFDAVLARIDESLAEEHYVDMLQRDVNVASGHATLRRVLQRFKQ
ncbi:MAG TPA: hypothetical protein VL284_08575 [Thermoanaerobaculia bacterium]|nr:hypothetical protein [Thermoanaerobaculia bacterium]